MGFLLKLGILIQLDLILAYNNGYHNGQLFWLHILFEHIIIILIICGRVEAEEIS